MHHTVPVGEVQCRRHARSDLRRLPRRQWALGTDDLRQAASLDVLHDDEVRAELLAPVVDGDDVAVGEPGRRLCLAPEPLDEGGVTRVLGEQDLHGHWPVQQGVGGEVDVGHPATRQPALQLVAATEHRGPELAAHRGGAATCTGGHGGCPARGGCAACL